MSDGTMTAHFGAISGDSPDELTVQFTNGSTGDFVSQRWSFGDGSHVNNRSAESNPKHTYAAPGKFRVRLEISSASGVKAVSTLYIEVGEPGTSTNSPPVTVHI